MTLTALGNTAAAAALAEEAGGPHTAASVAASVLLLLLHSVLSSVEIDQHSWKFVKARKIHQKKDSNNSVW